MTSPSPLADKDTGVGPPPPFDPECAAVLAGLSEFVPPSITVEMIPMLRHPGPAAVAVSDDQLRRGGAFTVAERSAPGPEGAPEISLLICQPTSATAPVGAIFSIHGGGMITGDNRIGLDALLGWAEELDLALISVEYRLAPETQHPGPVEDCYAGLIWVVDHADELGVDAERIVIAGGSAGGGLAAGVTLLARDRGGPVLAGQLLMSPMLDDRNNTLSSKQMAGLGIWDRASNDTGWTALLGASRGGPDVSPYAAPARAGDLSGLPPAFIDVGSAETFRDEDVAYASRIWQAGGIAELHVWPGGFHGYVGLAPHAQISQDTLAAELGWLRRLLAP